VNIEIRGKKNMWPISDEGNSIKGRMYDWSSGNFASLKEEWERKTLLFCQKKGRSSGKKGETQTDSRGNRSSQQQKLGKRFPLLSENA